MTMQPVDRDRPSIPAIYAQHILRLIEERDFDSNEILRRLDFRIPEGRMRGLVMKLSIAQQEELARTVIHMAKERGINPGGFGYEMGLSVAPATHGVLGFALLSQLKARQAVNLFLRFSSLILPGVRFRLNFEDGWALLEVTENFQLSDDLRYEFYEMALSGLWRSITAVIPDSQLKQESEIRFAHPEPSYHHLYRNQLPACHFNMDSYQLRCPESYLDRKLTTGDPQTARELEQQCQSELELVGNTRDIVSQVENLLNSQHGGYPDIVAVSAQLHMSRSTLRRKLQHAGKNFQQMREEAMRNEAIHLLRDPWIPVEKIAIRLGYADPANFTRAFRRWTGFTPSAWREQRTDQP